MNKQNTKTKPYKINWDAVDAAPLADTPDEDSPELSDAEFSSLRPIAEALLNLGLGKQRITIMLDEAIIKAYKAKAGKRGYPNPYQRDFAPWAGRR